MGNRLSGPEAERVRAKLQALARTAANLTELSQSMNREITPTTIGAVISGKYPPGLPIARVVARRAGLALEELLEGDPPEGSSSYAVECLGCGKGRRARLLCSRHGYSWRALPFGWLAVSVDKAVVAVCSAGCFRIVEARYE